MSQYTCDDVNRWLYDKPLKDPDEALYLTHLVMRDNPRYNGDKPVIKFLNHHTQCRRGYCYTGGPKRGLIGLPLNGQNWGTLAHEIAHLAVGARHHDSVWYDACVESREILGLTWYAVNKVRNGGEQ